MQEKRELKRLRLLIVEDDQIDAAAIVRELVLSGFDPQWERVETEEDYLARLDASVEAVISDYHLPQFGGLRALQLRNASGLEIPFIMVSGTLGDEEAAAVIRQGADDYLLKDRLKRLGTAVAQALEKKRLRDERKAAGESLTAANSQFRRLVEQSLAGIYIIQEGRFVYVNPKLEEILGYSREELMSREAGGFILEEDRPLFTANVQKRLDAEVESVEYSLRFVRKNGAIIHTEAHGGRSEYNGKPAIMGLLLDVTQRKEAEERLRQAQKMEVIGQLAGGIAHDLNNVLTVIQGYTQMLLDGRELDNETRDSLTETLTAAARAGGLTRQLLAFTRQQVMRLGPLNLNEVVTGIAKMLERVITENISLRIECAPGMSAVQADAGMLEQVLVNLAVNARDAMPQGGELIVRTLEVTVDEPPARSRHGARAGEFLCLTVTDTGCGMTPEVLNRIFEPFFTTKPPGKGTGLGLATVRSIAQQHNGWVEVESSVGRGTTLKVYLPSAAGLVKSARPKKPASLVRGGTETILVVEDNDGIRLFVAVVLRRQGYRVLEAGSVVEALAQWRERGPEIELVLTDMVLPESMTGRELVEMLRLERPSLRVIFSSGYCVDSFGVGVVFEKGVSFLPKPYVPDELLRMVRECLDSNPRDAPESRGPVV